MSDAVEEIETVYDKPIVLMLNKILSSIVIIRVNWTEAETFQAKLEAMQRIQNLEEFVRKEIHKAMAGEA
jgi:hypothetical protein